MTLGIAPIKVIPILAATILYCSYCCRAADAVVVVAAAAAAADADDDDAY